MACNECGGYREELVLNPRRDFMLTLDPPYVSFLLFRRGLLPSPDARGWLLSPCACLRRIREARTGIEQNRKWESGPGSNVIGALTSMFPLMRQRTAASDPSISPGCGALSTSTQD